MGNWEKSEVYDKLHEAEIQAECTTKHLEHDPVMAAAYEEADDAYLLALAKERMKKYDPSKIITQEEIDAEFGWNLEIAEQAEPEDNATAWETFMSGVNSFTDDMFQGGRELEVPTKRETTHGEPFYSVTNISHLRSVIEDIEEGKAVLVEHDLIEDF